MFLRFPTAEAREAFLKRAEVDRPDLVPLLRPAKTQETVVTVRSADRAKVGAIERLAGDEAGIFEDLRFEVFPSEPDGPADDGSS